MKLQNNTLYLDDDTAHKIKMTPQFNTIRNDFTIEPFCFTDSLQNLADGCIITIKPRRKYYKKNCAFWITLNKKKVMFEESILQGKGCLISQDYKGNVTEKMHEENNQHIVHRGGKGYIGVWIARSKGIKIINITYPKFSPDMEEELNIDDLRISNKFRLLYLKNLCARGES